MGFQYSLNSASDAIGFGRSSSWYQTGEIEIELVIKITNKANGPIFSASDPETTSENANMNILYSVEIRSGKLAYVHEYGTGVDLIIEDINPFPVGVWKRVLIKRIGTTIIMYIDGVVGRVFDYGSSRSPNAGTAPQQSIWIGRVYNLLNGGFYSPTGIGVAFIKFKGPTGSTLFTYGQDPGGSPRALAPEIGFTDPIDPFAGVFERPAQTQQGADEYDPFEGLFVRPPQRTNGMTLEPIGNGTGGEGEIKTPRAYPLEVQWKKANKATFEH